MGLLDDLNVGTTGGSTAGRTLGTIFFPETGPIGGAIGGLLGGVIGGIFGGGGLFGGGGGHPVNLPALTIPENVSGIQGGAINASSYHRFGPMMVAQTHSVTAAITPVLEELKQLGFEDSDIFKELETVNTAMYNANSPSDALNRNQNAVNFVSRTMAGMETLKTERTQFLKDNPTYNDIVENQIQQAREKQFFEDPENYKPDSDLGQQTQNEFFNQLKELPDLGDVPQDEQIAQLEQLFGVSFFDESSAEFMANEEAKTDLITAQEKFAALEADQGATQRQKDESKSDLRLKVASLLGAGLALGGAISKITPRFDDIGNLTKLQVPSSTGSITASGLLSNFPQPNQAQDQRGLPSEILAGTPPLKIGRDLRFRDISFMPKGFPVRGKGLLSNFQ